MSKFMVNLTAINTVDRQRRTPPIEVKADKQIIERDTGYAILTSEGYSAIAYHREQL